MSALVAIRPATSTWAPGPKNTPAGLMSQTCPLAVRLPMIWLTLPPVTRLSATELTPGCTNCTLEPAGMPKALQEMIALLELWVMIDLVGEGVESVAPPDCTWKPESPPATADFPPPASAATSAVVVSRRSRNRPDRRASLMAVKIRAIAGVLRVRALLPNASSPHPHVDAQDSRAVRLAVVPTSLTS